MAKEKLIKSEMFKQPKEITPINLTDVEIEKPVEISIRSIFDTVETVDIEPSGKPTSLNQQVKIYKNSTTRRLYWYDSLNDEWVYASGTAV